MPFYRRLNDLEKEHDLHAHLLVVMQEEKQAEDGNLEANGLTIDRVSNEPLAAIKVTGTPTLTLADAQGRIEKAWVGELSPQSEEEVVAAVEK